MTDLQVQGVEEEHQILPYKWHFNGETVSDIQYNVVYL